MGLLIVIFNLLGLAIAAAALSIRGPLYGCAPRTATVRLGAPQPHRPAFQRGAAHAPKAASRLAPSGRYALCLYE